MKKVVLDIETAQIEKRIMRTLNKKARLAAGYGVGAAYGMSVEQHRNIFRDIEREKWDMRQMGGKVNVTGNKFATQRKLFVKRGPATSVVYVKNARKYFEPLCVDGTLSSGRTWSELELPEGYRRTDGGVKDGGHVTVQNIVDAARERILGTEPVVTTGRWSMQR